MKNALNDIAKERQRQIAKWGPASEVDDKHSAFDWHEMISDYNGWARRMAAMNSPDKARRRYIQIAALALAAAEAIDRAEEVRVIGKQKTLEEIIDWEAVRNATPMLEVTNIVNWLKKHGYKASYRITEEDNSGPVTVLITTEKDGEKYEHLYSPSTHSVRS
ncbi:MAG: hypothetical protein C9356_15225 [Oleiphilus sp.]|nr:MAG: hypothetical protein C9356_15225 [Oleiphilus sp.]